MSKHVNPTGEGYAGTYSVRHATIGLSLGMIDHGWTGDEPVYAVRVDDGLALVQDEPADPVGHAMLYTPGQCPPISIHSKACAALGVKQGDDVRVYQRDAGGLLLVDADDDPRVGGHDA